MFKITKNLISWLLLLLWITKNYCQYGSYNIISVEAINEENINERFESRTLTSCYLRCQANPNCDRVAYQYESAAKDLITCYLIKNVATDSSLNVIKAHVITPVNIYFLLLEPTLSGVLHVSAFPYGLFQLFICLISNTPYLSNFLSLSIIF